MGHPTGFVLGLAADSMQADVQTYAFASLDQIPDSTGFQFSQLLPSYGVGISGALPLTSEVYPIQFLVDSQDVGISGSGSGGLVALADTGFSTTGLAVPFTDLIGQEGDMDMGLTWQDVVDGNTGIDPDSLYFFSDSAIGRMQMLPTRIQAQLSWWPVPELQVRARARAGSWMLVLKSPWSGWIPSKRLAFGVDYRAGAGAAAAP